MKWIHELYRVSGYWMIFLRPGKLWRARSIPNSHGQSEENILQNNENHWLKKRGRKSVNEKKKHGKCEKKSEKVGKTIKPTKYWIGRKNHNHSWIPLLPIFFIYSNTISGDKNCMTGSRIRSKNRPLPQQQHCKFTDSIRWKCTERKLCKHALLTGMRWTMVAYLYAYFDLNKYFHKKEIYFYFLIRSCCFVNLAFPDNQNVSIC